MGYGKKSYLELEDKFLKQNYDTVRIGILEENIGAKKFWTKLGFELYENTESEGNLIECFEKSLE